MTHKSYDTDARQPVSAIYPGSFDPFTVGHMSVLRRALPLFDHIYIAVGINDSKPSASLAEERVRAIAKAIDGIPRVSVVTYTGLTIEKARELGATFMLRGVRSVTDFQYEQQLADINRNISGIETVIIFTLPEHSFISSSMVRELGRHGHDVTDYLP